MNVERAKNNKSEDGFASIIIAIVLVIVLSLITVGFAQLMRREQRQALDKQLSSQAYFAAESGVNAASKAIKDGVLTESKPGCAPTPELPTNTVGDGSVATYPCLLVDMRPLNTVNTVEPNQSDVYQVEGVDDDGNPKTITDIKIEWESGEGGPKNPLTESCDNLRTVSERGNYLSPVRIQIVPLKAGALSRDRFNTDSMTAFLCPHTGGGTVDYNANHAGLSDGTGTRTPQNDGSFQNATCSANKCSVTITGLGVVGSNTEGVTSYFVNHTALYSTTKITLSVKSYTSELRIAGAQILIDSTGKAQDVLRRIQVRVSKQPGYDAIKAESGSAIDAGSAICKQLDAMPQTLPDGSLGGTTRNGDAACRTNLGPTN